LIDLQRPLPDALSIGQEFHTPIAAVLAQTAARLDREAGEHISKILLLKNNILPHARRPDLARAAAELDCQAPNVIFVKNYASICCKVLLLY
jgi:hypothetical protein